MTDYTLNKRTRELMLNKEIRRAKRQEKETLRLEVQEVKRQVREETKEARYFETKFKACARDLGLDPEHVWNMYQKHDKYCEICDKHESVLRTRLCIDHCHVTGAFRGFLCDSCNRGIGFLGDDYDSVKKALAYLEKF